MSEKEEQTVEQLAADYLEAATPRLVPCSSGVCMESFRWGQSYAVDSLITLMRRIADEQIAAHIEKEVKAFHDRSVEELPKRTIQAPAPPISPGPCPYCCGKGGKHERFCDRPLRP